MAKNVLGEDLQPCSVDPMTGWYRNGLCETGSGDHGLHCVCAVMSDEFLAFSKAQGNDLSTAMPHFGFPGLKAGDHWCLCVTRWRDALKAGMAPGVMLHATHISALEFVDLADLERHAHDATT